MRSWQQRFTEILPASLLAQLDPRDLAMVWASSILNPPTPRHRVLVAVDDGVILGYAAVGPSQDPDADGNSGELASLEVHPDHQRSGHGSRLLNAAVECAQADGLAEINVWCPLDDAVRRGFLQSAGWGPDSAYRDVVVDWDENDVEQTVREVRLVVAVDPSAGTA